MPAPYSYDFQKKAIAAVKRGEKKIKVCRMFQISRNTFCLMVSSARICLISSVLIVMTLLN